MPRGRERRKQRGGRPPEIIPGGPQSVATQHASAALKLALVEEARSLGDGVTLSLYVAAVLASDPIHRKARAAQIVSDWLAVEREAAAS